MFDAQSSALRTGCIAASLARVDGLSVAIVTRCCSTCRFTVSSAAPPIEAAK
jgi:hypothetical protein